VEDHQRVYLDNHPEIDTIPKGMVIHHVDGDHANNDPSNLYMCTQSEHIRIHNEQGDTGFGMFSDKQKEELYKGHSKRLAERNANPTEAMLEQREEFKKAGIKALKKYNGSKLNSETGTKVMEQDASLKVCPYCSATGFHKHAAYAGHISHCRRKNGG